MACVFGHPITEETLKLLPKYSGQMEISLTDRAREALLMKNAELKDIKARKYAEKLKAEWNSYVQEYNKDCAITDKICFLVLIYNATGDTLRYFTSHDKEGHIAHAPYPSRIANGQWGAFLHVQDVNKKIPEEKDANKKTGSFGAVVYCNDGTDKLGWLVVWNNPGPDDLANANIYGEVETIETYEQDKVWDYVEGVYNRGKSLVCRDVDEGGVFHGSTGRDLAPIYEAILTLEDTA